jgi:hydrogenase maturation factor HypF (carbamoyltransferase family)
MDRQHPHFGATYKIARQIDASFVVEVTFPTAPLVNVKGFATEALAAKWVANHEREIASGTMARAKLHLWKKET